MKIEPNKKYNTIAFYVIIIVAISLMMIIAIFKIEQIALIIEKITSVLMPVIWGFVLAYLLNPIMKLIEKLTKRLFSRKKPHEKLCRGISVFFTMVFFIALLSALIAIIIPQIVESIKSIFDNFEDWFNNIQGATNNLLEEYPQINSIIINDYEKISAYIQQFVNDIQPNLNSFIGNLSKGVADFLLGLKDFLLGLIVSIYLLLSKEKLLSQIKKISIALFSKKSCERIFSVYHKTNGLFMGFISGKIIDSFIIGLLCFIGLTFLKIPFVVLISVIIGVTNVIPFFGPIIGAIPSGLLVLLAKPSAVIPFVIFVIILQQFDGNILGPRILGDSIGLPPFWVLFSILIGGGLFGFLGMLLGVPTFALFYTLFREFVENKLKKKDMPTQTKAYNGNIEHLYKIKRANETDNVGYENFMNPKK